MYKRRSFNVLLAGLITLSVIILFALVYAGFTGQLNITGQAVNRKSNWDIHFENLSTITTTHTAKALTQPRLASSTSIEDYSVSTTTPGDSISFTFDVVNEGNYNAKITSVSIGTPECTGTDSVSNSNVCGHLTYTLTYDNAQIKYVVDSWAESTFNNQELKELDGYFARLLKLTEANNNLLCNKSNCKDSPYNWARSYTSWTFYDQMSDVYAYFVHGGTHHGFSYKCQDIYYVRPVINVYKSALLTNNTE